MHMCVLHTSKESSRFQIALIPSLASTMIPDVVPLTVTPNVTSGRDTLQQTQRAAMKITQKATAEKSQKVIQFICEEFSFTWKVRRQQLSQVPKHCSHVKKSSAF